MADREHTDRRRRTVVVTTDLTAVAVGSGDVPVLATPSVLALAEGTCAALLGDRLAVGETSVGTSATIEHGRATPVGREVEVVARLVARRGRRVTFTVEVREGDVVVARVEHDRVVVHRDRFLAEAGVDDA